MLFLPAHSAGFRHVLAVAQVGPSPSEIERLRYLRQVRIGRTQVGPVLFLLVYCLSNWLGALLCCWCNSEAYLGACVDSCTSSAVMSHDPADHMPDSNSERAAWSKDEYPGYGLSAHIPMLINIK